MRKKKVQGCCCFTLALSRKQEYKPSLSHLECAQVLERQVSPWQLGKEPEVHIEKQEIY